MAIYQSMQRLNWHCHVIAALPNVKKYSLQRIPAVFLKLNISKSSRIFWSKWLHFVEIKNFFILHQKHDNFRFPLHPSFKQNGAKMKSTLGFGNQHWTFEYKINIGLQSNVLPGLHDDFLPVR